MLNYIIMLNLFKIDDLPLQKFMAVKKIEQAISFVNDHSNKKLTKTASTQTQIDTNTLIELFSKMLNALNLKVEGGDVNNILKVLSTTLDNQKEEPDLLSKLAAINKNSKERKDEIKIVSKSVKDSHYQIDLSKDIINKDNKKMFMVSCYARDAYLGRYLIKRNFFYTEAREKAADDAYGELLIKIGAIKDRYYNEIIDVPSIFAQIKKTLDGVISEIKIEEDSIATNINRVN